MRLAGRGLAVTAGSLAAWLCANAASAGASNSLVIPTIKAAMSLAAGQAASAGVISTNVAALTEGVLNAMLLSKLKAVVAVVLVIGLMLTGAAVLSYRTEAAPTATLGPAVGKEQVETPPNEQPGQRVSKTLDMPILEGSKAGDRKELVPGIAFRWCPAGKFKMGEGEDAVDVELSQGFWLGETEVTQGQWQKLMGTRPWTRGRMKGQDGLRLDIKEGADYAASYISYGDAASFCKKLTTQEQDAGRLPKTWKYSLPTEAQWEYACRAGTKTRFSFGDDESQLSQYAWFRKNPNNVTDQCAHQVGLKKPNAWGLRDMHGNVWEWCRDFYGIRLPGGKDPVGPTTPPAPGGPLVRNRVVRGGCWIDPAAGCTSTNRFEANPQLGNGVDGFRVAAIPSSE
jgi:formylglycine-generating enzyme required for sulfatase activity